MFLNGRINYSGITRSLYCEIVTNVLSHYLGNNIEVISSLMDVFVIFWHRPLNRCNMIPFASSRDCVGIVSYTCHSKPWTIGPGLLKSTSYYMYFILLNRFLSHHDKIKFIGLSYRDSFISSKVAYLTLFFWLLFHLLK